MNELSHCIPAEADSCQAESGNGRWESVFFMSLLDKLVVMLLPLAPRQLVWRFARRYVAGETVDDMLAVVRRVNADGLMATVDVLGEFVSAPDEARRAADTYKAVLAAIDREQLDANISVKLTQMGLLVDPALCESIMTDLVATAKELGNFVRIDMEDSTCTSDTIALYLRLRQQFDNVGIVLQAYLRRTLADARKMMAAGAGHFRLCKGIYREPRAIAFPQQEIIHKNYTRVLEEMLKHGAYIGIATHHEDLVWEAMRLIDQYGLAPEQYEFQMLLGVDSELRGMIRAAGHRLRVYVPFGAQWQAYSLRRFRENPAIAGHILRNLFKPE